MLAVWSRPRPSTTATSAAPSRWTSWSRRCLPSRLRRSPLRRGVPERQFARCATARVPEVEGELRELRVRFANTRYRILYQRSENLIALLQAIEKQTGAIPEADIELAKRRMADFKRRMDAERRVPPRAAGKDAPSKSRRRG